VITVHHKVVVSKAVFIQKSKNPTLLLSILKVIQKKFINGFFTDQIRWWWALDYISQVAGKEVAELQCSCAAFQWLANCRDSRFFKL
jgi:hypothetical protein